MLGRNSANNRRKQALKTNQLAADATAVAISVDMMVIFSAMMKEAGRKFSEQLLNYITFPLAAGLEAVDAILIWRKAFLERKRNARMKNSNLRHAVMQTAAAVAIIGAVTGALVAHVTFAVMAPAIFVGTCALKALFNFGSAVYQAGKAAAHRMHAKKYTKNGHAEQAAKANSKAEKHKSKAKNHFVGGIVGTLFGIGIAAVMIFAKFLMAPLVIAGAAVAVAQVVNNRRSKAPAGYQRLAQEDDLQEEDDKRFSSTARMAPTLGADLTEERRQRLAINEAPGERVQRAHSAPILPAAPLPRVGS